MWWLFGVNNHRKWRPRGSSPWNRSFIAGASRRRGSAGGGSVLGGGCLQMMTTTASSGRSSRVICSLGFVCFIRCSIATRASGRRGDCCLLGGCSRCWHWWMWLWLRLVNGAPAGAKTGSKGSVLRSTSRPRQPVIDDHSGRRRDGPEAAESRRGRRRALTTSGTTGGGCCSASATAAAAAASLPGAGHLLPAGHHLGGDTCRAAVAVQRQARR